MARHRGAKKQQIGAWKTRNIMIFGFFIACAIGIFTNLKVVAKPKAEPEWEPKPYEKIAFEMLRSLTSIPEAIPTQNCHFASIQGRRSYQDDRVTCDLDLKIPFVGQDGPEEVRVGAVAVFDGHNGPDASAMASYLFLDKFLLKLNSSTEQSSNNKELLKLSLVKTIEDIDAEFSKDAFRYDIDSGSTAVVALIYNNHVLVANVGDSKAFLCSQKIQSHEAGAASLAGLLAKELTTDHNAHRLDERARVEASGGTFISFPKRLPLLRGHFPMTRAIGDVLLKRYGIIADPEVTDWLPLTSKDEFLVVASDGIFERSTPQEVCDFLNEVEDHSDPSSLAEIIYQLFWFPWDRGPPRRFEVYELQQGKMNQKENIWLSAFGLFIRAKT